MYYVFDSIQFFGIPKIIYYVYYESISCRRALVPTTIALKPKSLYVCPSVSYLYLQIVTEL